MPTITVDDLTRMREQLLFDGEGAGRKLSRFWTLLILAAVIASAGVVADSTATVIGAMIVAPLMTPIVGTVFSIVIGDLRNLGRSLGLVVSGAAAVVAVGYLVGRLVSYDVIAETSSQVAGRTQPRLIDLLAALATGVVGAFALVRPDVSDTLPGVAIAISLVPPLAVVGITLEAGAGDESLGALLLFLTNVGAIFLSGLVVMAIYHVRMTLRADPDRRAARRWPSVVMVLAFVVALIVPLAATSRRISRDVLRAEDVNTAANAWAEPAGWTIVAVEPTSGAMRVRAAGPLPSPPPEGLRTALDRAGLGEVDVRLVLTPEESIDLDGR